MKKATARPIQHGYPKKAGQYRANLLRLAIMPVCLFMFATCGGGEGSGSTPDTTAPTVISTSPASNGTDVSPNIAITVTFSENMDTESVNNTTFQLRNVGNQISGTVVCVGSTATFRPDNQLNPMTTYNAIIATGVKDLGGNPLAQNYPWAFTTRDAPDTTPPQVGLTSPDNNATDVLVTASITATFSEAMDPASIDSRSFTLEGPGGFISGTVSISDFTATLTPTDNLAFSTSYAAGISTAVKDLAGNRLPSDTSWNFTTVSAPAATLLSAHFDSGTDGFLYQDDTFLGTSQSSYASGTYEPTGGHGGGGLHVTLGGVDNSDITGMSGGWTYALNLSSDVSGVMLSFRYRLQQSANYEYDEYSRMLVSVDGMLHGRGSKEYVDHVGGDGDGGIVKETGWLQHQVHLGALTAGPHTLLLGGYANRKNASNESTDIWIDDVVITSGNPSPTPSVARTIVDRLDINRFKSDIQTLSNYGDRCRMSGCAPYTSFINAQNWAGQQLGTMGYAPMKHNFTFNGFSGSNLYATKVGTVHPDKMYIISAHLDGRGGGGAADDDASGVALVLEAARVFAAPDVRTDISIRFILWDNEESGLYGSNAYVNDRRSMQGMEDPPVSGQFPEPNWLGIVQHDMILYDHGVGTAGPDQSPYADLDVEWRAGTAYATQSMNLAQNWRLRNGTYSTRYPANSADHSTNTDDTPFQNDTASISVRENRRSLSNEWINPYYHQNTDVHASYQESDFILGFNAVQATVGLIAELSGANVASPNNPPVANSQPVRRIEDIAGIR